MTRMTPTEVWRLRTQGLVSLSGHRGPQAPGREGSVSASRASARTPARGWLRARGEPHVELRSLAVGHATPPRPPAALHGEGRAVQPADGPDPARGRRLQGAPRRGRPGGDADRRRARPRRRDRGHVPGGDAAAEGPREETPGPSAHGRRADCVCRERPARSRCDQRHRPPPAPRAAAGRIRCADRPLRPRRPGHQDRRQARHRASDGGDRRAQGDLVKPLLVVDGDSLAHRAYHAMPKSIRFNGVLGFANMLLRLWENEQPRAVLVGWDTYEVPTYRHEEFEPYQSGRVFEDSLLEQLPLMVQLVTAEGFAYAKEGGYEADDFLGAAVAFEEGRGGEALVATSDRDLFQLASDRTTILQPVRGVSELARIGPPEVVERYGVEPAQVPDFIALRGDPSDKLPGAAGVGPKKAADVLRQYGSLEAALEAGRFSAEAEDLRLYRRIATVDASAPLPPLDDQDPTWAEASSLAREWGLDGLADRLAKLAA